MSFRNRNSGKALLPFGLDFSDVLGGNGDTDNPEFVLPVNGPLNTDEENAAKQSIAFSKLMIDGPFFTGSTSETKPKNSNNTAADGIQRYSDKYKKVKKVGRTIEEHPYQIEFFPEELYLVINITDNKKKKLLSISTFKSNGGLKEYTVADTTESDKANEMLEKLKNIAEDLDASEGNSKEEEEEMEEDIDDEFDEDDDDDYNAEKYFDDGDDDMADNGDDEAAF